MIGIGYHVYAVSPWAAPLFVGLLCGIVGFRELSHGNPHPCVLLYSFPSNQCVPRHFSHFVVLLGPISDQKSRDLPIPQATCL
jgi:hypothetical protein